ncbi:MAG: CYTH domain-containing protein [Nanoarchaeota archaeon]
MKPHKEIEVKILEISKKDMIYKLEQLKAKKVFSGISINEFYEFRQDGGEERQFLRLRREIADDKKTQRTLITLKRKLEKKTGNSMKAHEEIETEASTYAAVVLLFAEFGFRKVAEHTKHRLTYLLGGVYYNIDEYEGLPAILEIESRSEKSLPAAVKRIGHTMQDTNPYGIRNLFKLYNKEFFNVKP